MNTGGDSSSRSKQLTKTVGTHRSPQSNRSDFDIPVKKLNVKQKHLFDPKMILLKVQEKQRQSQSPRQFDPHQKAKPIQPD